MKGQAMKIRVFCCILGCCLLALGCPLPAGAVETVRVDVLYMNHGPLRPTIRNLHELFDHYPGKVNARWYDEDQNEGKAFMKETKVLGHVPLLMLVNGKKEFALDGRTILFEGFPSGSGPFKEVEGNWSIVDLQQLLDSLTR